MQLTEAEFHALYQRVRGLKLRIQNTPQATPWICSEAERLAAPLTAVEQKLGRPRGAQQALYLQTELLRIQRDLQMLFREHPNPLMGRAPDGSIVEVE